MCAGPWTELFPLLRATEEAKVERKRKNAELGRPGGASQRTDVEVTGQRRTFGDVFLLAT
jgi:hypothetical protein